jgi:hypothetical protein
VPWIEASIAACALGASTSPARAAWLPGMLDGSRTVTAAAGWDGSVAGDTASGVVTGVVGRPDAVVVAADHAFLVSAADVIDEADPTSIDTTLATRRWTLVDAPAVDLGLAAANRAAAAHRLLAAAAMLGLLREAVERLVPYLTDRMAFGTPIAAFQAIQHRLVDLFLSEVRAGVTVDAAARALAADPDDPRPAAIAHAYCADHVPGALDECIQLTGGIGFTWEYPLHHELRRSVSLAATCGGARRSRAALLRGSR